MTEVAPGVFFSGAEPEEWEPDPEVGGEVHILCSGTGLEAGLSRFRDPTDPVVWTIPGQETLLVLEGEATIEIAGGPATSPRCPRAPRRRGI